MKLIAIIHAVAYLVYAVLRIPFWSLTYLIPSLRQHPKWTWRQALRVRLFRAFIYVVGLTRLVPPLSMTSGSEGERFVVVEPQEERMYQGVLACDKEIKPAVVGGTWYPELPQPHSVSESKSSDSLTAAASKEVVDVVLYFHGGGYTLGDGRIADCGFAASTILDNTPTSVTHVFCPQYRLSGDSGGRFPAAFQDALTSYLYLVRTLDMPAERVVLSGDSAGGHMVIQLLQYLGEFGDRLGIEAPKAAWLWSPWCDVKSAVEDPTIVYRTPQHPTDFLPDHRLVEWAAEVYPPHSSTGVTLDDPYISPARHSFRLVCPVWAMVGGVELNLKEVTEWCDGMRAVAGNRVEMYVEKDAPHDVLKCGGLLGFEIEAQRGVKKASDFIWPQT